MSAILHVKNDDDDDDDDDNNDDDYVSNGVICSFRNIFKKDIWNIISG